MENDKKLPDDELLTQLYAAREELKTIYEYYDRANQMKEKAEKSLAGIEKQKKSYYICGICMILVAFPFGILISVLIFWLYRMKKKEAETQTEQCRASAAKEESVAEQIIIEKLDVLSVLPNDYWYPLAVDNIIKILQQGRASTLNDAMDRFDALRREWLMDQRYAEMSAELAQQSGNLASIERSSRINTAVNVGRAVVGVSRGVGKIFDSIG